MFKFIIYLLIVCLFSSFLSGTKGAMKAFGIIGDLAIMAIIITAFWHYKWWSVILSGAGCYLIGSMLSGALLAFASSRDDNEKPLVFFSLIAVLAIIVFSVLCFTEMCR